MQSLAARAPANPRRKSGSGSTIKTRIVSGLVTRAAIAISTPGSFAGNAICSVVASRSHNSVMNLGRGAGNSAKRSTTVGSEDDGPFSFRANFSLAATRSSHRSIASKLSRVDGERSEKSHSAESSRSKEKWFASALSGKLYIGRLRAACDFVLPVQQVTQ